MRTFCARVSICIFFLFFKKIYNLSVFLKLKCLSISLSVVVSFAAFSLFDLFQIGVRLRLLLFFFQIDERSVLFVCWFWAPFFEQVVFAIGVFVVTSVRDVLPEVKRRFRLFA